jgi:hypothetical protein
LIDDADGLIAIGSNYGRPTHPKAELLTGDARATAWATTVDFYAGYDAYRTNCAPREIRVFKLRPIAV